MFRKLVKYEFLSVGKWYLGIYAASLGLSTILGFWIYNLFGRLDASNVEPSGGERVLFGTSFMTFGIMIATLLLTTFFMVINRFRKNVYGRQGYLTMTLPVSSHQIILSKLLVSLIWYILASITALLSIGIILSIIMANSTEAAFPILGIFNSIDGASFFSYLLSALIETIAGILLIYFSISVGQLFKDHRLLFAILTYIGISIVLGVIVISMQTASELPLYPNPITILINILLAFGYYFGTHYIMSKKLNLQ